MRNAAPERSGAVFVCAGLAMAGLRRLHGVRVRWGVYPWREYGKLSGCGRGAESKPITHTIPHQMDARPLGGVASRRASVDLPAPGGPERITARPASQGLP